MAPETAAACSLAFGGDDKPLGGAFPAAGSSGFHSRGQFLVALNLVSECHRLPLWQITP
jgi:hypothetical protein